VYIGVGIFLAMFGLVGLFLVGAGVRAFFRRRKVLPRARPLKGKVVEIEKRRFGKGTSYYPLVEVTDSAGRKIRFLSEDGGSEHQVKVKPGDRVDVLYDPVEDQYELEAFLRSFYRTFFLLVSGIMFLVFATGFFWAVFFIGGGPRLESLVEAINARDESRVRHILDKDPELVNKAYCYPSASSGTSSNGICRYPLYIAAGHSKSANMVQLLIDRGADVKKKDNTGQTALHSVAYLSGLDRIAILLEHGADINALDNNGITPLHIICGKWHNYSANPKRYRHSVRELLKFLVAHGADVNVKTKAGETPLHMAAENNRFEQAIALCALGANMEAMDNDGSMPIDLAMENHHQEMVQLLGMEGKCRQLVDYRQNNKTMPEAVLEIAVHETMCEFGDKGETGDAAACTKAGRMHRKGDGIPPNDRLAVKYFRLGCGKDSLGGCNVLGLMLRDGKGAPKDEKGSVEVFRQACEKGLGAACTNLGVSYEKALGVKRDYQSARLFYDKGCKRKSYYGCNNLGRLLWYGHGGPADKIQAKQLFTEACNADIAAACRNLKKWYP
jgi:ankyrin repeat protein